MPAFAALTWLSASLAGQMATLDKAEALLDELRVASVEAARRDLDEVTAFAAEQARTDWLSAD